MYRVLFLADKTVDDPRMEGTSHPGGAELTDAAAVDACPWPVEVLRADEVDPAHLKDFDVHIVGNFDASNQALTDELCRLGRHVLFEHDLRICFWRGNFPAAPEYIHRYGQRCICPHPHLRRLYDRARGAIFLTHRQLAAFRANPFFGVDNALVLGTSLMNRDFFSRVDAQSETRRNIEGCVMYSSSAFKGYEPARRYCVERGCEPFVIRNLSPEEVLDVFERTRQFVYLPRGREAAGRMVLEARFLGCEVVANQNVAICQESWWHLGDDKALEVVRDGPKRFWRLVQRLCRRSDGEPTTSGGGRLRRAVDPMVNAGLSLIQRVGCTGPLIRRMTAQSRSAECHPRVVSRPTRR